MLVSAFCSIFRKITDFDTFVKGFEFLNLKGIDLSIPFSEKKYKKESKNEIYFGKEF